MQPKDFSSWLGVGAVVATVVVARTVATVVAGGIASSFAYMSASSTMPRPVI